MYSYSKHIWELTNSDTQALIATGSYNGEAGTILLITSGDYVAIFLDNNLIYQGENFESIRKSNRITGFGYSDFNGNGYIEAVFDNFKFWNLDDADF